MSSAEQCDKAMLACAGSLTELEESSGTAASLEEAGAGKARVEEHLLTGHTGAVVCLAMYEDHLLFSGSTDCTIKVCVCACVCAHLPVGGGRPVCASSLPRHRMLVTVTRSGEEHGYFPPQDLRLLVDYVTHNVLWGDGNCEARSVTHGIFCPAP